MAELSCPTTTATQSNFKNTICLTVNLQQIDIPRSVNTAVYTDFVFFNKRLEKGGVSENYFVWQPFFGEDKFVAYPVNGSFFDLFVEVFGFGIDSRMHKEVTVFFVEIVGSQSFEEVDEHFGKIAVLTHDMFKRLYRLFEKGVLFISAD